MRAFARRGGWWVVGQTVVFVVAIAGMVTLDDGTGWGAAQRLPGWVLTIAGAAIGIAGLAALGRSLTPFPEPLAAGELVEHGIYRLARHPIYGGVALGFVGLGLANDSLVAVACGLLLFPYFFAKSAFEERHLLAAYPGYEAYRQRVRKRLLPWIL